MVLCHNQSFESKCDLRNVLVSTRAIHFFGTPHTGANVTMLQTITKLVSMYKQATNTMLKGLRANSSQLENIQTLYVAASEGIRTIFFCEDYATSGIENLGDMVRRFYARVNRSLNHRMSPITPLQSLVTATGKPSCSPQPTVAWSDSQLERKGTIKRSSSISKITSTMRLM